MAIMISEKTNTWSGVNVYKVADIEKYRMNPASDEGLTLIRQENKSGKVLWEDLDYKEEENNVG